MDPVVIDRNVRFLVGTRAEYDSKAEHDETALYFLTDTKEFYKGGVRYGTGDPATEDRDGLLSAEDKRIINNMKAVAALVPVDASVVMTTADGETRVGVRLSGADGNAMQLLDDGLYVPGAAAMPAYEIEKEASASGTSYRLKRTSVEGTEYAGEKIEVPDNVMKWEDM